MNVLGWFFIAEGAIALGYALFRAVCVRQVDLSAVPRVVRHRVEVGNQIMPWLGWTGVVAMGIGAVLSLVGASISE